MNSSNPNKKNLDKIIKKGIPNKNYMKSVSEKETKVDSPSKEDISIFPILNNKKSLILRGKKKRGKSLLKNKSESEQKSQENSIEISKSRLSIDEFNNVSLTPKFQGMEPVTDDEILNEYMSKEETSQNSKKKYVKGYTPFILFEKEKCKDVNFKEVKACDFIKLLSFQWRTMTDDDREPYIKKALEIKKNFISEPVPNLINKKRKRTLTRGRSKETNIKKNKDSSAKSFKNQKNVSTSRLRKNISRSTSKKKLNRNNSDGKINRFLSDVLAPFVSKAYDFLSDKGIIDENKQLELDM